MFSTRFMLCVLGLLAVSPGCGPSGSGGRDGGVRGDATFEGADGAADGGDGASSEDPYDPDISIIDAGPGGDSGVLEEPFLPGMESIPDEVEPVDVEEPEEPREVEVPDPDEPTVVRASYRFLHWNIAGGKEHRCATREITDAVVRMVRERDSDFVSLNEVCPSQYDSIREALRELWGLRSGAVFSAFVIGGGVGNAIYSREDLLGFTRERIGNDRYGARNLLCGRLRSRPSLRFCSTHLSPATSLARPQFAQVRERLEGWWEDDRDTVILAGDFNLEANDRAFDGWYAAGANHPEHNPGNSGDYRELDDDDAGHCRGYGERSVPRTGGGPCREGRRIDLIFARANRIVDGRYGSDTRDIPRTCGGLCSDHRPVSGWARLRIRIE
jgi:endonuclease/exonuclease/phosphatase family metal-dependent hydrolase